MEEFKNFFTDKEIELLRCIILERERFYTKEILQARECKHLTLNEDVIEAFNKLITLDSNYRDVITKFIDFLDGGN